MTRGEAVTFLKRYNDNVVEPAIAEVQDDADDNAAAIDNIPLFATITEDGEVYEGANGLVSSTRNSEGNYTLTFDRDVSQCAVATSDLVFSGTRDVSAEAGFGASDEVGVRITNETDALEDSWFNVIVMCAPGSGPTIVALDAGTSTEAANPSD